MSLVVKYPRQIPFVQLIIMILRHETKLFANKCRIDGEEYNNLQRTIVFKHIIGKPER